MTLSSVGTSPAPSAVDAPADAEGAVEAAVARRSRWLLLGTLVALLVVYLPLLGPSLAGQKVFAETGLVLRFEPWSLTAAPEDQTGVTIAHDTMDSALPAMAVFRERVHDGDFPVWSPYVAGGTPFASVPEQALLSPLSLPYLVLPYAWAPGYVRLLEVLAAVGFMFLFLRRLRLSSGPALLGGLVYSCTAFLVLWNNWPQAQVAALVPALFWSVERALQVRRPRAAVPVALALAAMVLASFPAVIVYACYLLGPYVLVRTLATRARVREVLGSWLLAGAGLVLGVGLVGFQVLPFVSHLGDLDLSHRAQAPTAHAPFSSLVTLAVPYAFGSETDDTFFGYRNPVEMIAFVGVVCLVLALVAVSLRVRTPVPRGVVGLLAGTVVTLVLVGFSSDTALGLAQELPLVGSSFIGRVRAVLGFALAVLAAVGAERLVRLRRGERAVTPWSLLPVLATLLAGAYAGRGALAAAVDRDRSDVLLRNSVLPALVLLGVLGLAVLATRGRRTGRIALLLLPLLVAAEGLAFLGPRWPSEDPEQLYPVTGVHAFLGDSLDGQRYAATAGLMFPSTNSFYGLRAVSGHAFHAPTWKEAVARVDPTVAQAPTLTFLGSSPATASSPVLDRLAARYFVSSIGAPVHGAVTPPPATTGSAVLQPGDELVLALSPGPRRALVLPLTAAVAGGPAGRLRVVLEDAGGRELGAVERLGLAGGQTAGHLHVPLPADAGPLADAARARLSVEGVTLSLGADEGGDPVAGDVRPVGDGLAVAFVGESVVYERTRALPRVRYASSAVPAADATAALDALASGRLADDEVVLRPDDAAAPAQGETGADGTVRVLEDSGDVLRVQADGAGAGWVVVADAMQSHGWRAEVDGEPAALRQADHAGVAVAVPPGRSEVTLRYVPPGLRTGAWVSVVSVLAALGLVLAGRRYRDRRPDHGTAGPLDGRAAEGREHHGVERR